MVFIFENKFSQLRDLFIHFDVGDRCYGSPEWTNRPDGAVALKANLSSRRLTGSCDGPVQLILVSGGGRCPLRWCLNAV